MLECVARRDILKFFADELWPVDCYYGVWYAVFGKIEPEFSYYTRRCWMVETINFEKV